MTNRNPFSSRADEARASDWKARDNENQVLAAAAKLNPGDRSEKANLLREVAEDIQDRRSSS